MSTKAPAKSRQEPKRKRHGGPRGIETLADLRDRCRIDDETGCWHVRDAIWFRGRCERSARAAVILAGREIPEGHVVWRSVCWSTSCANPAHCKVGTDLDAKADRKAAGRTKLSPATIAKITATRRKTSPITIEIARELRQAEGTHRQVADRFGLPFDSVRKVRQNRMFRQETGGHASVFAWAGMLGMAKAAPQRAAAANDDEPAADLEAARSSGAARYVGQPCPRGHVVRRRTDYACVECESARKATARRLSGYREAA